MPVLTLNDFRDALLKGQCLIGLDPGSVAIGVAVSDPGLTVASPLTTILRKKFADDAQALKKIMIERRAAGIVIGLPRHMDGSEGPSAQSARAFIRNLFEKKYVIDQETPVLFWDERLSSAAVERFLLEDDMSRRKRDNVIDKAAAAYILQGALDALKNKAIV